MRILMAASECVPFAKTGGLGDVVGALPVALADLGHEVAVILPRYQSVTLATSTVLIPSMSVMMGGVLRFATLIEGPMLQGKVRTFFIDHPPFFDRPYLYGPPGDAYWDNGGRFAFFCNAVMEAGKQVFRPDVLHCHDWQTALLPVLRHSTYTFDWAWGAVKTVFSIHNIRHQGNFDKSAMPALGLSWELFTSHRLEHYDRLNMMKGGIVYCDRLSTVSPRYAREIQSPASGFGLDGVIRDHAGKLRGILNGVDYTEWDPATDPHIAANYSPEDLSGKRACKRDVLREFGLPCEAEEDLDRPLIGIVSRFDAQKGFDLIAIAANELLSHDVRLIVLGTGARDYESLFLALQKVHPEKVALRIGFSNPLAHKVEAGADIFLMPSHDEPCGLNQMYSLKYGTPPVVHATGGLDDTVDAEVGFKFAHYDGTGMMWAIREALEAYRDRDRWRVMQVAGMKRDHSWKVSAREYEQLYMI